MNQTDKNNDIGKVLGLDSNTDRKRKRRRWIFWGLAAFLIAALVLGWRMRADTDTVQYKTQLAKTGNLTVTVTATGNLQPTNQVDVGSELSGTVRSVEADYNQQVKVGDVLARLDRTRLEADAMKARASLESALANLKQAEATVRQRRSDLARLKNVRTLSKGKAVSQIDLDSAAAEFDRALAGEALAKAGIDQAKADVTSAETNLSKSVIHSPIDGVVLVRSVEPGQTVAASLQAPVLFTLAEDLTQMELHVDVDEADVGQVKAGQSAAFTVDAYPDRTFSARITQVRYGAKTVDGVVTYETVLQVDNSDGALRPGMTATADITVKSVDDALLIPNAALRYSPPLKTLGSSGGGVFRLFMPRRPAGPAKKAEENGNQKKQKVWVLRNGQPVPVFMTAGATDGVMTAVTAGDVHVGMELIVDSVSVKK